MLPEFAVFLTKTAHTDVFFTTKVESENLSCYFFSTDIGDMTVQPHTTKNQMDSTKLPAACITEW